MILEFAKSKIQGGLGCRRPSEGPGSSLQVIKQEESRLQVKSEDSHLEHSLLPREEWVFLFYSGLHLIRWGPPIMESNLLYPSPPIQMLISPQNILTQTPRMFNQPSEHPTVPPSWHIKSTIASMDLEELSKFQTQFNCHWLRTGIEVLRIHESRNIQKVWEFWRVSRDGFL